MGFFRAILLAVSIAAIPFGVGAQFTGAPGDISFWLRGKEPACRQQSALWREASKHSEAIQAARKRDASVDEACGLFKTFLLAEEQYVKSIEEHGHACGLVPYDLDLVRRAYVRAVQLGKDICEAAVQSRKRPLRELWNPDQDSKTDCRLCGKTGDFWWLDKPNTWPRRW